MNRKTVIFLHLQSKNDDLAEILIRYHTEFYG